MEHSITYDEAYYDAEAAAEVGAEGAWLRVAEYDEESQEQMRRDSRFETVFPEES